MGIIQFRFFLLVAPITFAFATLATTYVIPYVFGKELSLQQLAIIYTLISAFSIMYVLIFARGARQNVT